jgi:hypothetical protein
VNTPIDYREPIDFDEWPEREPWWAMPRPWLYRHTDADCPPELDGWRLVYDDLEAAAPVAA